MTEQKKVTIEVDGRTLEAQAGAMLIDVTDAAGILIPRFCYHKKLSVAANCRMCLVEVANVPKPLPACATPVNDGMKVSTRSPKALAAQRGTMEFLLINHPLDCPICDQGGECELQDVAMGYGGDVSRYVEDKRVVKDQDIGPLIATDMTRCIHCTRCVRFGAEIAGIRELGATGRGEHMRIGTFIERSVDSELSGNVIDLCPVGALTSKPFRFSARAWELTQREGVAPHDAVGANLHLHIRDNRVMRVHPKDNEAVNECWISDRDRFSYAGLYAEDRLRSPLVKRQGEWQEVEWEDALQLVAERLKALAADDPGQLAALASPAATLEELYLLQQLWRGLGSGNIDHRLRQYDFRGDDSDPPLPWLGLPIAELENLDAALVIGSNIRKDLPLLGHRLRKAALKGASLCFVNPLEFDFNFEAVQRVSSPLGMVQDLAAIAQILGAKAKGATAKLIKQAKAEEIHRALAERLQAGERVAVLLGDLAIAHPEFAVLRNLAYLIAERAGGASIGYLLGAANTLGARLAGALPNRGPGGGAVEPTGEPVTQLLAQPRRGYLLFGVEPGYDFWDPAAVRRATDQAEFVVALTAYRSPSLEQAADVMLPLAGFAETAGTYVNLQGDWQGFSGAVSPLGQARPGWKILRVLGNLLDLEGFEYVNSVEVRRELEQRCAGTEPDNALQGSPNIAVAFKQPALVRVADVPIYALDPLVRRSAPLQATRDARAATILVNPKVAAQIGLAPADQQAVLVQDGKRVQLPLTLDPRVPDGCVWVSAGLPGTEELGGRYAAVTLEKLG